MIRGGLSAAIGRDICAALGIDPARVTAITIRCRAGDLPTVSVEMVAGRELVPVFERYEIKERASG